MLITNRLLKTMIPFILFKLMNDENEWDHRISAGVKEGPEHCIRIEEVSAALKKMKRDKAPSLSGLVAEMIQTTRDIGTQWILVLCNGIMHVCMRACMRACCIQNISVTF